MTNDLSTDSQHFASIVMFLRERIVKRIKIQDSELGNDVNLPELGVTSLDAVLISGEIEDHYGVDIDPIMMFQYRTVNAVAEHLASILPAS